MLFLKRTFWVLVLAGFGALFISVGKHLAKDHPGIVSGVFGFFIAMGGVASFVAAVWMAGVYCFGDRLRSSPACQALARRTQLTPAQKASLTVFIPRAPVGGGTTSTTWFMLFDLPLLGVGFLLLCFYNVRNFLINKPER